MENSNGGGPMVPFGDGDHAPLEDTDPESHRSDLNMESIFKNIFLSCDENGTGLVLASDLIDYVTPFLLDSELEFDELKRLLDPNGTNPTYDIDTYIYLITQWATQVRNEGPMRQISNTISNREINEAREIIRSPSEINVGDFLSKPVETDLFNTSECNNSEVDVLALQEQMKQLKYENRKLADDLKDAKVQLISSEEHNDVLQIELEKIKTKFKAKERQLIEQSQKTNMSPGEILLEPSTTTPKQKIIEMEKRINSFEKQVFDLKETINVLEARNHSLEDFKKAINHKGNKLKEAIFKLEMEISSKDEKITILEEHTSNLQAQLEEQQENINHYSEINECLKEEKSKIEDRLSETLESKNSSINEGNLNSPIHGILCKYKSLNFARNNRPPTPHPKLLNLSRQLAINVKDVYRLLPVEPKKSIDSDEGSIEFSSRLITNYKFQDVFSTPVKEKKILDTSLPSAIRKAPTLFPYTVNTQTPDTINSQQKNESLQYSQTPPPFVEETSSLPTLFVVERTDDKLNSKTTSEDTTDSTNNDSIWKLQLLNQLNDSESLQVELLKAGTLESRDSYLVSKKEYENLGTKIMEYEHKITELSQEVDRLKEPLTNSRDSPMSSKIFRCINENCQKSEINCQALQSKISALESDNNLKYIKIVDLMEEIENFNEKLKNLKSINEDYEAESQALKDELKAKKTKHTEYENVLSLFNILKQDHEKLQKDYAITLQSQSKLLTEFDKVCKDNSNLESQLKDCNKTIGQLREENVQSKSEVLKLKEECDKLKLEMDAHVEEQTKLSNNLNKMLKENEALKENVSVLQEVAKAKELCFQQIKMLQKEAAEKDDHMQSLKSDIQTLKISNQNLAQDVNAKQGQFDAMKGVIDYQRISLEALKLEKDAVLEKIATCEQENEAKIEELNKKTMEQITLLKTENDNCLINFTTEIQSLKSLNQDLVQDANGKQSQVDVLKEIVDCQKAELNELKTEREAVLKQLQTCVQENDTISREKQELFAKLDCKHKEQEQLAKRVQSLEELKEGSHMEIQSLLNEVKNVTDINNNILRQVDALLEEKNDLVRSKEQLEYSIRNLTLEKQLVEEKLAYAKEQHEMSLKNYVEEIKLKDEENSKLVTEMHEKMEAAASISMQKICKECSSLERELENRQLIINDLLQKNRNLEEKSNRIDSFNKMQIKIDRLEEKVSDNEENLKQRQYEMKSVQLKNTKLTHRLSNLKCEMEQLATENIVLKDKLAQITHSDYKEQADQLKKEVLKLHAANEKLSNEYVTFQQKSESVLKKKDQHLMECDVSIGNLKKEIDNLKNENGELQKAKNDSLNELEELKSIKLLKEDFEKLKKENDQLKLDLAELNNLYVNLEKKDKDSLESIGKENAIMKGQMNDYFIRTSELEKKLEKTQHDLQKSEAKNFSIRKALTDVQSNVGVGIEDAVSKSTLEIKNYEEIVKGKSDEIATLQEQLKNCQDELAQVRTDLDLSKKSCTDLSEYVRTANERIGEKRHRLARSTLTAVNAWRLKLESVPENHLILQEFDKGEHSFTSEIFVELLDEEMYKLKHQIQITSLFLDLMASLKSGQHNVETQASPPPVIKTIKKFTLKEGNVGVEPNENFYYVEKGLQTSESVGPVKSQGCLTMITSCSQSRNDCQIMDQAEIVEAHEEYYTDAKEDKKRAIKTFNSASPSLADVLEHVVLSKYQCQDWTLSEVEKKFEILQAAFNTDRETIETRCQAQHSVQCEVEESFTTRTTELMTTLLTIKKLEQAPKLEETVELELTKKLQLLVDKCVSQLDNIIDIFSKATISAMQYGALFHEQKISICIYIIILHSVYLKDVIGNSILRLKSITAPQNKKRLECLNEISQSVTSTNTEEFNNDFRKKENYVKNAFVRDEENFNTEHKKKSKLSNHFWYFIFLCFFMFAFVVYNLMITEDLVIKFYTPECPWTLLTWKDFHNFLKLDYRNGPPPI